MAFADRLKKLDAHRLQQSVKATIQSNGRLTFTVEATKEMGLSEEKSLVIFEADGGDLGAVISVKDDPEAFVLKKCGLYYYVAFKNYLQQAGIDYKGQRIIYDITELDEKIEGKTLYQFARRVLPKTPEQLPITDVSNGAGNGDGSGDGKGVGSGAGNGDGSGDGRGFGSGAGEGDGTGEGYTPDDDEFPQDIYDEPGLEIPIPLYAPRPAPAHPAAGVPQMPRRPAPVGNPDGMGRVSMPERPTSAAPQMPRRPAPAPVANDAANDGTGNDLPF